jgi:molybdopterin synthase catalytic subunit
MIAMADLIEIVDKPFDVAAAIESLYAAGVGGVDVFLGTTRSETRKDGVELVALDYDAYRDMALHQMRKLATDVREKWPVANCVILHRVGRVELGRPSILIGVSTPHRKEAFLACKWLVDELKKSVTLWKKEVWADGKTTWIHPT